MGTAILHRQQHGACNLRGRLKWDAGELARAGRRARAQAKWRMRTLRLPLRRVRSLTRCRMRNLRIWARHLRCEMKRRYRIFGQSARRFRTGLLCNRAASFFIRCYISSDDALTSDDLLIKEWRIKDLKRGRSEIKKLHAHLPRNMIPSGMTLFAVIDEDNDVPESDETNNTASTLVP
jgi:hypothetical protein